MASTPANTLTLACYGIADARLQPPVGNPDPRQFVKVLRKTTRWAAQWNRVEFDGRPEFGQRASITLPRKGDLVTGFNIVVTMPDIYATQLRAIQASGGKNFTEIGNFLGPFYGWTNSLGHALIQRVELEIGGAIVETIDGRLLEILDELYTPLEAVPAKNAMIKRAPSGFTSKTWVGPEPLTVSVQIPFWFSRPGVYSHALPIDSISAESIKIHVTFRPIGQLYFTNARVDTRTVGYRQGVDPGNGAMWPMEGGRFWRSNADSTKFAYSLNIEQGPVGILAEIVPDIAMPLQYNMGDAYALVEYISLEEYEAMTLRSSELTYHVEQHMIVPVEPSRGNSMVRIGLPYANPVKELLWVAQPPEAEAYNAWFLFTRDIVGTTPLQFQPENPCRKPWWPDAVIYPTRDEKWQCRPAFQTAYSEPFDRAMLVYNSYERFSMSGMSYFRALVPSMHYQKSAIHDRYVYAYNFGKKIGKHEYHPSGTANWDKLPKKEFYLTMKPGPLCTQPPNLNVYVYVTIWNVFKVFGGRGGMLFAN